MPQARRKYFISGPQWAAAYEGHALFHAPTRKPVSFEQVIREFARIGVGYWTTHDTDVIPYSAIGKDEQAAIVARIKTALPENGLRSATSSARSSPSISVPDGTPMQITKTGDACSRSDSPPHR